MIQIVDFLVENYIKGEAKVSEGILFLSYSRLNKKCDFLSTIRINLMIYVKEKAL